MKRRSEREDERTDERGGQERKMRREDEER